MRVRIVLRIATAAIALLFTLTACEEAVDQSNPRPSVVQPPVEPSEYVGNYGGAAGRTTVNLEVKAKAFAAAVYVEGQAAAAGTLRTSSVGVAVGNWYLLEGTVDTSGSTVTLRVETVKVGTGLGPLDGEALAVYTSCEISGTAGDAFDNEILADIVRCVGVDGASDVKAYQLSKRPSDLIVGTWEADLSLINAIVDEATLTVTVSATELSSSMNYDQRCDVEPDLEPFNDLQLYTHYFPSVVEGEDLVLDVVLVRTGDGDDGSLVVVEWSTRPGDAQGGVDYVAGSGELSYSGDVTELSIRLVTVEDDEVEGYEIFFLDFTPDAEHSFGSGDAVVVIRDDDGVDGSSGTCLLPIALKTLYAAEIGDTVMALKFRSNVTVVGGYEEVGTGTVNEHSLDFDATYVIDATGNRAVMNFGGIHVWFDRRVP